MSFFSRAIEKYQETKRFIERNPLIAAGFFLLSAVTTTLFQMGIDSTLKYFAPSLDDTAQIIENQNKQFDEVRNNLSRLQSQLSGSGKEVFSDLKQSYEDAFKASQTLAVSYEILKTENDALRKVLKKEKGMDAGYDILITVGDGYRIDSAASFGTRSHPFEEHIYMSLTSRNANENITTKDVSVGQGVSFTSEKGKTCSIVFLGKHKASSDRYMATFAKQCKA